MKNERLKTYRERKKNRDKRHFRRIYNMEMPIFFFCLFRLPKVFMIIIYHAIVGKDMLKPWFDMLYIARIRKQIMYYRQRKEVTGETVRFKYHIADTYIEVRVYFGRKIKLTEYEQLAESCTIATHMKKSAVTRENGYYAFKLLGHPLAIKNVNVDKEKHKICVGQDFEGDVMWDFDVHSCALIAGKPRNGKTTLLMYLMNSIISAGWNLWMIDGKDVDYIAYQKYFDEYVGIEDIQEVCNFVSRFHQGMVERYKLMHKYEINKYTKLGLEPCFLICDEFLSVVQIAKDKFNNKNDKKIYERFMEQIGDLVRRGPASGYQVVLGMQRADTTFIPGETRSNIQFKVVLGNGGKSLYEMMFEGTDDIEPNSLPVGYGWYQLGLKFEEMAVPYYETIEYEKKTILEDTGGEKDDRTERADNNE